MIKITKQELNSLQAVILYLTPDESKHYQESNRATKRKHIFKNILILAKLVDKLKRIK